MKLETWKFELDLVFTLYSWLPFLWPTHPKNIEIHIVWKSPKMSHLNFSIFGIFH